MVTPERIDEIEDVVRTVADWAAAHDDVRGVVMVGSWARGQARMDSDVDLVVLTDAATHAEPDVWIDVLGAQLIRLGRWGPLRELRLRRPSGLLVEIGVAPLSWAETDPVDPGTFGVIRDGHRIVYDPDGVVATLCAACV